MMVGWAVVRSLAGFPGAGPTGADYLGGTCLLWLSRLTIRTNHYVDRTSTDYVDIFPLLIAQAEGNYASHRAPFRLGLSPLHQRASLRDCFPESLGSARGSIPKAFPSRSSVALWRFCLRSLLADGARSQRRAGFPSRASRESAETTGADDRRASSAP